MPVRANVLSPGVGLRRHLRKIRVLIASLALGAAVVVMPAASALGASSATMPRLDHVFVIMEENNGFSDVIGNPAAPNLNHLANTFGLETNYFGVSSCCSEANYVGLLGGSTFNVNSDDAYWKNSVHAPSLISQLDQAGVGWKAYLQSLPHPNYEGICYPEKCNGAPDSDPLYVSKHDGIQNFTTSWNTRDWSRQVPVGELANDLRTGDVPRFSYVVPDECHDMHGDPPYCLDSGNIGDPQNQHLVSVGDAYLGHLVSEITNAPFWAAGNNAIAITFDEGDDSAGCCDANPGAGQVATIVVTSHGPRGVQDSAPANHYSLLSSIQQTFGLGCLQFTCDTANVQPITPLFAITGSAPIATQPLPQLTWPTPTPTVTEPTSMTTSTQKSGGWTVQKTQLYGTSDNSLGAVAGSSPTDVWAAGNFLPDTAASNQDATLSFAEHYDGKKWSVVPTPNTGTNFNSFYGLAASQGQAWAVGEYLNSDYQDRALIETWNGQNWSIADNPQPGSVRDMLFGASALSPSDVWVVGDQEGSDHTFQTLVEHWDGSSWTVVPTPDPGSAGNHLYAVDAVSPDDVWAAGMQLNGNSPDQGLVEHWDGHKWSVVPVPTSGSASLVMLDGIAATSSQVWVAGEADSPEGGGQPIIEGYHDGSWTTAQLPATPDGANWTNLWGITVASGTVWAVGTYVDPATDNNNALVLEGTGGTWSINPAPNPGSGSNILGGIANVGGQLWAAGVFDNGGSGLPLIMHR
ncbi:MAG TPA: alkaline phosphatase family protein [Streptosporangiaceae bacterium]|nr:alkaline phosphatase family protein [Streptosporangiaceae bacterium]